MEAPPTIKRQIQEAEDEEENKVRERKKLKEALMRLGLELYDDAGFRPEGP